MKKLVCWPNEWFFDCVRVVDRGIPQVWTGLGWSDLALSSELNQNIDLAVVRRAMQNVARQQCKALCAGCLVNTQYDPETGRHYNERTNADYLCGAVEIRRKLDGYPPIDDA